MLLHMDGTSHYATADILSVGKWCEDGGATVVSTNPRRAETKSVLTASGNLTTTPLAAPLNYLVLGFAVRSSTKVLTVKLMSGSVVQLCLYWNGNTLSVYRGDLATLLATMSVEALLFSNNWYFITFAAKIHDSTGTFTVHLGDDALAALTKTNQDTKPGTTLGIDRVRFVGAGNQLTDLYLDDETIHGNCIVDALYPVDAGEYAQWTPSTGANWQNVDDPDAPDGDATQNSTAELSAMDTFAMTNLRARTGSVVKGVGVTLVGRKDCVAARAVVPVVRVSDTEYASVDALALSADSYTGKQWLWDENPYTSASWEQAEVNAMEIGYQLSAAE